MLGHAGGIDEILIVAIGMALLVVPKIVRDRRERARAAEPDHGPCLYCGTTLEAGVERCPGCGFRARRGGTEAPATAGSSARGR